MLVLSKLKLPLTQPLQEQYEMRDSNELVSCLYKCIHEGPSGQTLQSVTEQDATIS